jgi:steroid delta-isomerase-like uncharacterized protein
VSSRTRFDIPERSVLEARQKVVLDHVRDEIEHDWDATLSTFPHPRYELISTMTVHDGDAAVRRYYDETRTAFPDQRAELIELRHSHDAVVAEFWLNGTHRGPLGKIPATGSSFRVRMTAFFQFDEDENLIAERIYFDTLTMLKQLLATLDRRKPRDLIVMVKAVRGLLAMSGDPDPVLAHTSEPPELAYRPSGRTTT